MTYFFITGEASGSNYAANVVNELKFLDSNAKFFGLGCASLKDAGCEIVLPLEQLEFMGFSAVVKNIFTIRKNFNITKAAILKTKPDVVCLVDYAGFNLRMAKWCKQNGFKVVYYILPKVWAWNSKRINQLKKYCDKLISIFPFEVDYFEQQSVDVSYFGNPLTEFITPKSFNQKSDFVALLPGSRKQEISALMPIFVELAKLLPHQKFKIVALNKLKNFYPKELPENIEFVFNSVSNVVSDAKAAVVCSGTATLEVALLEVPQIIVYKTGFVNYQLAKRLIKVKYIGLPNLIMNKELVPELIQNECTPQNIKDKLLNLGDASIYNELKSQFSNQETSKQVAQLIFNLAL